ncbi:MAG: ABC transporter permease [Candidatus Limnocylindria bacterium]
MTSLLPNAWHIARREYRQRTRSRTFVLVTVFLALIGLAIAMLPVVVRLIGGDSATRVAVHASDPALQSGTVTALNLILNTTKDGTRFIVTAADDPDAAAAEVRAGKLDGLLTVTRGADGELSFDALTDAGPNDQRLFAVRQAVTQVDIGDRLRRAGVDASQAGQIFAETPWKVTPLDPNAHRIEENFGANYILAYALVILTFMAVITYGQWVATSVAEEKSSRVMELLITAATPRQLLAGKVIGNGAAGLTQYAVVVAAALGGFLVQGAVAQYVLGDKAVAPLEHVNLWVFAPFGIFFVGGFALYALLYAGLGSMASRTEDVQQATGPMIFIGLGGYFASFIALNTPDAAWVKLVSLIPFFSPYMLPMRMLISSVEPWEWAVGAALMVLFLAAALWLAARVYSAGVLLYGQRASLRSVWRAVRVDR